MKIGYARVSTDAQETHLQLDALKHAECARIYQEKASGAKVERPELMKLLDHARKGDVVIVWKLDRLARSLRQLIDTTVLLNERGVELHSLTENINTLTTLVTKAPSSSTHSTLTRRSPNPRLPLCCT